jgi:hypothetical protein
VNISLVPKKDYEFCFNAIHDYLEKSAKYTYGRFTADDIKQSLLTTDKQLWIAYEDVQIYGFVVTEIVTYPQIKSLMMHFTGGLYFDKWHDDIISTLKKFAKDVGCKIIESQARLGWSKILKKDGYKPRFYFFELPLE